MPKKPQNLTKLIQQQEQAKHFCGVHWVSFQTDQFLSAAADQAGSKNMCGRGGGKRTG